MLVAKTIPLEEWAKRENVRSVTLSPNGEKLAMLRIMSTEGMPVLEVYDASDLSKRCLLYTSPSPRDDR